MNAARVAAFVCGAGLLRLIALSALGTGLFALATATPLRAAEPAVQLDPFAVQEERIEGFGFGATTGTFERDAKGRRRTVPIIHEITPNTAAAKAGLQPGDRILKSDGQSTAESGFTEKKWRDLAWQKELATRREKTVRWQLEIESADRKQIRTVTLVVPTAPPRWGAAIWQPPEGRTLAVPIEEGPLADRARVILANGIWTKDDDHARPLGILSDASPFLGYAWTILTREPKGREYVAHRFFVTQRRGRTDIILVESGSNWRIPTKIYLTSPSGKLEKAWGLWDERKVFGGKMRSAAIPAAEAEPGLRHEIEFWLTRVGQVSARWPLELIPAEIREPSKK
jgi:hypothetical protein